MSVEHNLILVLRHGMSVLARQINAAFRTKIVDSIEIVLPNVMVFHDFDCLSPTQNRGPS